jgi:DNA-binding transcriptional regulator YdaS (Cro superfamily)
MNKRDPILKEVFEKAGGVSRLARRLGITRQAVSIWRQVPAWHVPRVSAITSIAPNKLRPDIYLLYDEEDDGQTR